MVVGNQQQTQPESFIPEPVVVQKVTTPAPIISAPAPVVSVNNEPIERHDSVIVGGKQKTMTKSSAYLMDMITIEKL
jgi:hypothetical protein